MRDVYWKLANAAIPKGLAQHDVLHLVPGVDTHILPKLLLDFADLLKVWCPYIFVFTTIPEYMLGRFSVFVMSTLIVLPQSCSEQPVTTPDSTREQRLEDLFVKP